MSGHSKWSTIKRAKGANDAKRSQIFTKLAREIAVAARAGDSNPDQNPRLRLAIDRARDSNMPKDNIARAIKRGSGDTDGEALLEITYEGFGPGGTAILVDVLTDNRNRTVADVRNAFTRAGGNLGDTGSVAWQFEARGLIVLNPNGGDAEELALQAMDTGADDVRIEGDAVEVYTAPDALAEVRKALSENDTSVESAELMNLPTNTIPLDENKAKAVLRLLDTLDDLDDVQRVSTNADFPESVLASYGEGGD
jgi:YebC/PmpR family DNA-binding regulatory protein